MKKVKVKPRSSTERPSSSPGLFLSAVELEFLRDIMSVRLPLDLTRTASQALAEHTSRIETEDSLWEKIVVECERQHVKLGDDAPDYLITASSTPALDVITVPADIMDSVNASRRPKMGNPFESDEKEEK